ncbi:MAG: hypothetical protein KTR18_14990 [Acidiferrobacterales bacterium]|nr:hypothetical protein [Acidiferrobacterales bacterium]
MLDEIFLHAGMHKTGSSALQRMLAGYDDGTTFYADLGSSNHSLALRTTFDPDPEQIDTHVLRGRSAAEVQRLKIEYLEALGTQASRPGARMILSGEGVCDLADEGVAALRDWLVLHAKKVTVFAYVREPVAFVNSYFAESIKHDLTEFDVPTPEYVRRLGRFRDAFPHQDVHFRIFDPQSFDGGSLVADFCKIAAIDRSQLPEENRSNESLPVEAVQILFRLNCMKKDQPETAQHVHTLRQVRKAVLEAGASSKFRLSGNVVHAAISQDDIDWFETETLQRFDAGQFDHDPQESIGSLEELLSFRPQTKAFLFQLLEAKGISTPPDDVDGALAKLYESFRADISGTRPHVLLRKMHKGLRRRLGKFGK